MPNNKFERPSDNCESTSTDDVLPWAKTAIPHTKQLQENVAPLPDPKLYPTDSEWTPFWYSRQVVPYPAALTFGFKCLRTQREGCSGTRN